MNTVTITCWTEEERQAAAKGSPYYGNVAKMEREMAAPNPPLPRIVVPAWQDAGKRRKVGEIIAERETAGAKAIGKLGSGMAGRCREAIGKSYLKGYVTTATNGGYLIAKMGTGERNGSLTVPGEGETWTMNAEIWRAYSRVRTCRPQDKGQSHGVRWELGEFGLVLRAGGVDTMECEASERVDGNYPAGEIMLDDRYIWPLRGVSWTAGLVMKGDGIVLTAEGYAVVVMGLRR